MDENLTLWNPISEKSLEFKILSWQDSKALHEEMGRSHLFTRPRPTRDEVEWTPKAKQASRYLNRMAGVALDLIKLDRIDLARDLIRLAEARVGPGFYDQWQDQVGQPERLRPHPRHLTIANWAPPREEIDTWDPRPERAAVVEETE